MSRRNVTVTVGYLTVTLGLLVGLSAPSVADSASATGSSTGPVWAVVSAGEIHTCGLQIDHTVWCWGDNTSGELGVGDNAERTIPTQVGVETDWAQLDVGAEDTCAIRIDHTLWCWGWNGRGQLGVGDTANRWIPTEVGTGAEWATVSLGQKHTCAIRVNHSLWCWGDNWWGQLGFGGTKKKYFFPHRVETTPGSGWAQVSTGDEHTCGTRLNHALWCWGYNQDGELGLGYRSYSQPVPVRVGHDADWGHLSLGGQDTCATRTDQTLWCWGTNSEGQLGVGDNQDRYSPTKVGTGTWGDVSASYVHTCAIQTDHSLWCWGAGYPLENDQAFPTRVGTDTDWANLSDGYQHTCGIRTDATLWCWGFNHYAQLGLGDHDERLAALR